MFQLDAGDGHKGNHVCRADAGINPLLAGQVDQLGSFAGAAHRGLDHRGRIAGNRHNGAIVRRVHGPVEQMHSRNTHRGHNGADLARIRTF